MHLALSISTATNPSCHLGPDECDSSWLELQTQTFPVLFSLQPEQSTGDKWEEWDGWEGVATGSSKSCLLKVSFLEPQADLASEGTNTCFHSLAANTIFVPTDQAAQEKQAGTTVQTTT